MKITEVTPLAIHGSYMIEYERFGDERGYFTETFRWQNIKDDGRTSFLHDLDFQQCNESYSTAGVVRGLHFQWNPNMGKLVRTVMGHMVDIVLDIRIGSPTFGKAILADLPATPTDASARWIWVPPGCAHGNFFTEETTIEYFCSTYWKPDQEAGISPLSEDIDWSMCDPALKTLFDELVSKGPKISDKDRDGFSVGEWERDERSKFFTY